MKAISPICTCKATAMTHSLDTPHLVKIQYLKIVLETPDKKAQRLINFSILISLWKWWHDVFVKVKKTNKKTNQQPLPPVQKIGQSIVIL